MGPCERGTVADMSESDFAIVAQHAGIRMNEDQLREIYIAYRALREMAEQVRNSLRSDSEPAPLFDVGASLATEA
jgi:hypothetical protein